MPRAASRGQHPLPSIARGGRSVLDWVVWFPLPSRISDLPHGQSQVLPLVRYQLRRDLPPRRAVRSWRMRTQHRSFACVRLPWGQVGSQGRAHLVPVSEPEAQDVLQLPQADGAEVRGPPQGLIQAECTLHEAAEPAAVPQAQEVTELMACDLRGKATSLASQPCPLPTDSRPLGEDRWLADGPRAPSPLRALGEPHSTGTWEPGQHWVRSQPCHFTAAWPLAKHLACKPQLPHSVK